ASAARRAPSSLDAQVSLGQFYLDDARPFQALWTLQEAQRLDPKAPQPRLLSARALAIGPLNQPALARLQAAVPEPPGKFQAAQILNARSAEARYYLGMLALRKGPSHEEEARQKFAEAVSVDERFAPAHVQLGAYYQRHHDWDKAAAVLRRAFELDPENADALLQLSQVRRARGDLAGASY